MAETYDQSFDVVVAGTGAAAFAAAITAADAGLKVVMDRCPKIEYGRLSSEISWMGINSRTLSSKRAQNYGGGFQRMGLGINNKRPT